MEILSKSIIESIRNRFGTPTPESIRADSAERRGVMARTQGNVQSAMEDTAQDAMASVTNLMRKTSESRTNRVPEDQETPILDYYEGVGIDASVDADIAQEDMAESLEGVSEGVEIGEDVTGLDTLMSFIGGGESYGGSLDAANRGTIKDEVIGSTKVAERDGKKLSEMTLGEIKEYQRIRDPNNPDRLFAVGKYQMIPDTLAEAQKALGISDKAVFDEDTQTRLGEYLLKGKANTRKTWAYLSGQEGASLDDAVYGLAREFASIPVPYDVERKGKLVKAGSTYYTGSGNKAKYSVDEVKSILRGVRDSLQQGDT